jgi:hypothetical protein
VTKDLGNGKEIPNLTRAEQFSDLSQMMRWRSDFGSDERNRPIKNDFCVSIRG